MIIYKISLIRTEYRSKVSTDTYRIGSVKRYRALRTSAYVHENSFEKSYMIGRGGCRGAKSSNWQECTVWCLVFVFKSLPAFSTFRNLAIFFFAFQALFVSWLFCILCDKTHRLRGTCIHYLVSVKRLILRFCACFLQHKRHASLC